MLVVSNDGRQEAFEKKHQLNPPVLVLSTPDRPLIMYLAIHDNSIGCVLGQHDESEEGKSNILPEQKVS